MSEKKCYRSAIEEYANFGAACLHLRETLMAIKEGEEEGKAYDIVNKW